jgi:hypothetical protein
MPNYILQFYCQKRIHCAFKYLAVHRELKASELTSESCKEANVDLLWKVLNWKLASSF